MAEEGQPSTVQHSSHSAKLTLEAPVYEYLSKGRDSQPQKPAEREAPRHRSARPPSDPIEALRRMTTEEFIPIFMELVEKYAPAGVMMEMDASNFLEGGREVRFEFAFDRHRLRLAGTVTDEGIAFHETRVDPAVWGQVLSGPMLRLHNLRGQVFRDFICERLAHLIRNATRRH